MSIEYKCEATVIKSTYMVDETAYDVDAIFKFCPGRGFLVDYEIRLAKAPATHIKAREMIPNKELDEAAMGELSDKFFDGYYRLLETYNDMSAGGYGG